MSPCWEVSPTQCVWEEKGDFNQWIRPEQIALGRASVLNKPWGLVEPVASSNAILSSTPLQLPHVKIAFLFLGILVRLRPSRNPDFYVKSLFENIWLNKNSGRKRKEKKKALCRQNTSVRQMSRPEPRPLVSDLCSAQSGSALLLNLSSYYTFSCPQHSRHSGFLSHYNNFWSLPYSGSFMLLFSVYNCLGSFSFFRPQQDFHSLGIVFPDSCLKFLPDPVPFVSLLSSTGSQKCGLGIPGDPRDPFKRAHKVKTSSIVVVRCIVFAFCFHLHSFMIE